MEYTKARQYIECKLTEVERMTLKKRAIDERITVSELVTKIIREHLFIDLPLRTLNPRRAHAAVNRAIKAGQLAKLDGSIKCADCDQPATEYDHRDYQKPLEVEAVCKPCNIKRGPGKNNSREGLDKRDKRE